MAIAATYIRYVFGLRTGISGCLAFMDESTIVYPCGSNIILYNMETRTQRFLTGLKKSEAMTAMAISPNRRFVALAERLDKRPVITIFDMHSLKKTCTLVLPHNINVKRFVNVVFSPDSKFLAAQGSESDWNLVLWSWEKGKLLTTVKTAAGLYAVNSISFNPDDNTLLCVVGDGLLKNYRYVDTEKNLRQFGKSLGEQRNILSHAWLSDSILIIGTNTGILILLDSGVKKGSLDVNRFLPPKANSTDTQQQDDKVNGEDLPCIGITAIVAFSNGFAAACGQGRILWFESIEDDNDDNEAEINDKGTKRTKNSLNIAIKENDDDVTTGMVGQEGTFPYVKMYEIQIPQDPNSADPVRWSCSQTITQISISPNEESLVCCSDKHQLYHVLMSTLEMTKKGGVCYLEMLSNQAFHYGSVIGVDVCLRKPLIATCSKDNSVRIWNYEINHLELYKEFAEEIFSIALHPTGLYCLVGFTDKLRLMNLLIDDIRTFKEFNIRNCKECSFSTGGQLIAAVNGNLISIYSTTTFQQTASLKGHNGKIRSLLWSMDDRKLISCGLDGAVYEWDPFTGNRLHESVIKSCGYNDITISTNGGTTYAVGTDKTLKEISESQIQREISSYDTVLTCVALSYSGRMLLCGTSNGTVRAMKFPLTLNGEYQEHLGHCAQITKMKITHNDEYLITVSEDLSVMIWSIMDRDGRGIVKDKELSYSDEILITKFDLEQKNAMMTELKTRVEELKVENEYQLRLKDMNYKEKMADITKQFVSEMEALRIRNESLHAEKDAEKQNHEEELQEVTENHTRELDEVQEQAREMLKSELTKYHELMALHQKTTVDYEQKITQLEESRETALEELTQYYENKIEEKTQVVSHLTKEMRDQTAEYDSQRRLIEEDADREILDIKLKYERRLREERETNSRLKGETGVMRRKFATLNKDIMDQQEEIRKCQTELEKMDQVIRTLEKEISGLKKEVQERDETIQDKEKRIYDLKKRNQELEKFKFVLDYKVQELRKQIEPREREIRSNKEQIKNMELELDNSAKEGISQGVTISELHKKLHSSERQLAKERCITRSWMHLLDRLKTDLYTASAYIQEPKKLKENVLAIVNKYVTSNSEAVKVIDADITKELDQHRQHLEKRVASLSKKIDRDTELNRNDYIRMMRENISLITGINDLRRELKLSRTYNHQLEATLQLTRTQGATAKELLTTLKTDKNNPLLESEYNEARHIIQAQISTINTLKEKLDQSNLLGTEEQHSATASKPSKKKSKNVNANNSTGASNLSNETLAINASNTAVAANNINNDFSASGPNELSLLELLEIQKENEQSALPEEMKSAIKVLPAIDLNK